MSGIYAHGPDVSGSVVLIDGTNLIIPGKVGLQIVLKSVYLEKGSTTSVDLNWKDPSSTIVDTSSASVVNLSDICLKGPVGAGLEANVVGGGGTGRLIFSLWYVSTASM